MPQRPSPRRPGRVRHVPPQRSGISSAVTVVWRPLPTALLISAVRSLSPGSIALRRPDLPTPDGPVSTLVSPQRHSRSASIPCRPPCWCRGPGSRRPRTSRNAGAPPPAHEVDLVHDDRGRQVVRLGKDEEAVQHAQPRLWLRGGEDDDDRSTFATMTFARRALCQARRASSLRRSSTASMVALPSAWRGDLDLVARDDAVAGTLFHLEPPPERGSNDAAFVQLHFVDATRCLADRSTLEHGGGLLRRRSSRVRFRVRPPGAA